MLIQEYTSKSLLDLKTIKEVSDLVYSSNIGERFNFGDFLYLGFIDDKVVAIESFKLEKYDTGEMLPRFTHIIYHKDLKRSKEAVKFLLWAEQLIKNHGYKKVWAYILKNRVDMLILARKFGFKDTEFNGEGYTLLKEI